MPNGENLGALVDALEASFGFGDGFDGSNPKFRCTGRVKGDANALPAVFEAEQRTRKRAAEAEILRAAGRFEKAVGFGGCEKIDDRLDADSDRRCEGVFELQPNFAADFATVRSGAEGKAFCEGERGRAAADLGGDFQVVFADELSVI